MKTPYLSARCLPVLLILLEFAGSTTFGQAPVINSLKPNGQLTWTYGYNSNTNDIARIEISSNLAASVWRPLFYDFVSTNISLPPSRLPIFLDLPTNSVRTVGVPMNQSPAAFFRIGIQGNIPDTNLVLHLGFNNDFSRGVVLDSSGYGNHGLRYGATNWPTLATGPDGRNAADFHWFAASDPSYFGVGQYISVLGSPSIDNLTQTTIMVWAHYITGPTGDYSYDSRANILDTLDEDTVGSWSLGRHYGSSTTFVVATDPQVAVYALGFPDDTPTGDTGGWHHYAITFDGTTLKGYFDTVPTGSYSQLGSMTRLCLGQGVGMSSYYLAVGTWMHGGTPQFNDDLYPNCCWMDGTVGDIRIYNRVLSTNEIAAVYNSFDNQPPTVPANLWTRAAASNQIELRWTPSTDNFRVTGYTVSRNNAIVATVPGPSFVDTNLPAGSTFHYRVDAFDGAGNHSAQSAQVTTNTPTTAAVSVVIDDEDGPQRFVNPNDWHFSVVAGSYGTGFHFTNNVGQKVTFLPTLPVSGSYDVYAWYGGLVNGAPFYIWADNVPVDIVHSGVTNTVLLNEQQGYASWQYLGTFNFNATTNEFVRFRTDGTAGHGQGYVGVDAIMFVR